MRRVRRRTGRAMRLFLFLCVRGGGGGAKTQIYPHFSKTREKTQNETYKYYHV